MFRILSVYDALSEEGDATSFPPRRSANLDKIDRHTLVKRNLGLKMLAIIPVTSQNTMVITMSTCEARHDCFADADGEEKLKEEVMMRHEKLEGAETRQDGMNVGANSEGDAQMQVQ